MTSSGIPEGVDVGLPSAARLYDYLLGGGHNFAADRTLAEELLRVQPNARTIARLNRAFLRRAVLFLIEQGIRQFLDLGSGIPTVGNVHEIAQKADPRSRVVYIDLEDVAVAHSRMILEGSDAATIIQEDVANPDAVLGAACASKLIDFTRPVGVLAVGVFHFVSPAQDPVGVLAVGVFHFVSPAQDPVRVAAAYRDAVVPGSYLALSHFTSEQQTQEIAAVVEVMKKSLNPLFPRTRAEITGLLDGFEVVEPGVVPLPLWRPDYDSKDDPDKAGVLGAVGRKA